MALLIIEYLASYIGKWCANKVTDKGFEPCSLYIAISYGMLTKLLHYKTLLVSIILDCIT